MDPRSLLDRFTRKPEPPAELTAALGDLTRLAATRPDLGPAAQGLAAVLKAAFATPEPAVEIPDLEAINQGWANGTPAYRSAPPRLDDRALITRIRDIARAFVGTEAKPLADNVRNHRLDFASLAREILAGRPEVIASAAKLAGLSSEFLASVLRLAILPALAGRSAALDHARPEGVWSRGDCPNCGSRPILAESRGLEQRIFYRCGLCAGGWSGERIRCPGCGELDSKKLKYRFVEGEESRYRLADCESCSDYWKVVSSLAPLTAPGLLVTDLATFHLDVLAED